MRSRFSHCQRAIGCLSLALGLLLAGSQASQGSEISVSVAQNEPPAELDDSIRALLDPTAYQVKKDGAAVYDFWFCKRIQLKSVPASPGEGLSAIPETALLGAVRVRRDERDYRDDELYAGVYTIRLGLRPEDGDHLGTSEFLTFATLIPAKLDTAPGGIQKHKQLTKASSKESSEDHPFILYLMPVTEPGSKFPSIQEPAPDHQAIRIKLAAGVAGSKETIPLVFDLVVEGVAEF